MVAGISLATNFPIHSRISDPFRRFGTEEQMIDAKPRIARPSVPLVIPVGVDWRTRVERQWRNRVTLRCLRELGRVHRDGAHVTVLGPGEADLEALGSNLMDVSRRPRVIETSLRTSAHALRDPAPLPDRTTFEDVG